MTGDGDKQEGKCEKGGGKSLVDTRLGAGVPVPEIVLMAAVSFYLMGDGGGAAERRRDDRVSAGKERESQKEMLTNTPGGR